jgi:hypothetical protein
MFPVEPSEPHVSLSLMSPPGFSIHKKLNLVGLGSLFELNFVLSMFLCAVRSVWWCFREK